THGQSRSATEAECPQAAAARAPRRAPGALSAGGCHKIRQHHSPRLSDRLQSLLAPTHRADHIQHEADRDLPVPLHEVRDEGRDRHPRARAPSPVPAQARSAQRTQSRLQATGREEGHSRVSRQCLSAQSVEPLPLPLRVPVLQAHRLPDAAHEGAGLRDLLPRVLRRRLGRAVRARLHRPRAHGVTPIPAATVILVRPTSGSIEVFLVRRHRKASFMSNAFVFPGGKVDPTDGSPEVAAVRELFEEAGVLWTDRPLGARAQAEWRRRLLAGEVDFPRLLADEGLAPDHTRLHGWSRWVTPSFEPKRFDALFFIAELPPDQVPSFDQQETVEELWITPAEALLPQAARPLAVPPPQLRTFHGLAAAGTLDEAVRIAAERRKHPVAICPRLRPGAAGVTLLLPWDPEYPSGEGEGEAVPPGHILAVPPSRMSWTGKSWDVA